MVKLFICPLTWTKMLLLVHKNSPNLSLRHQPFQPYMYESLASKLPNNPDSPTWRGGGGGSLLLRPRKWGNTEYGEWDPTCLATHLLGSWDLWQYTATRHIDTHLSANTPCKNSFLSGAWFKNNQVWFCRAYLSQGLYVSSYPWLPLRENLIHV